MHSWLCLPARCLLWSVCFFSYFLPSQPFPKRVLLPPPRCIDSTSVSPSSSPFPLKMTPLPHFLLFDFTPLHDAIFLFLFLCCALCPFFPQSSVSFLIWPPLFYLLLTSLFSNCSSFMLPPSLFYIYLAARCITCCFPPDAFPSYFLGRLLSCPPLIPFFFPFSVFIHIPLLSLACLVLCFSLCFHTCRLSILCREHSSGANYTD